MIEIGIGVLFAILFVTTYLIVKRLLGTGERGQSRWRGLNSQIIGGSKRIASKPDRLFLTNEEMRKHHSKTVTSDK